MEQTLFFVPNSCARKLNDPYSLVTNVKRQVFIDQISHEIVMWTHVIILWSCE